MNHSYYIIPILERYKTLPEDSPEAKSLALQLEVNIGDKEVLTRILSPRHLEAEGTGKLELTGESPVMSAEEKSGSPIDAFLDKFGKDVAVGGYLAQKQWDSPEQPDSRNEGSGEKASEKIEVSEKNQASEKEEDGATFTQSELKKLISGKRYREALQLIERQNLNNPQKSIYFAHQMRFIKKLIAIENYKNTTQG